MTNIGRQMPCSLEAENAIIGALLIDPNAFKEIESIIKSDDFYLEKNKLIFSAVERLNAKHSVIDMVTVMQEPELEPRGFFFFPSSGSNVPAFLLPSCPNK